MQGSHSNSFTPINNPMDHTHESDEHFFNDDDSMDLSGMPHSDLLHDTSRDPAWEPDYEPYKFSGHAPSYEEESTSHHRRYPQGPTFALTDDQQTTSYPPFSPGPSQPQPQPAPRPRPRLRRVLARISSSSSSSPPSPPLPPVTTYSHALSPARQTVNDRTSDSPESIDGGVPLDTVHALICQHPVPLPPPCEPIPDRCTACTTTMYSAYTLNMKTEWELAQLDPDTPSTERSNARRAYFRARAEEQNHLDSLADGGGSSNSGRAEEALREAGRRHRGAQRAVFFEAGTPLASRGRLAGAFKRESRHYVPGRWVGEWEDTSGMRQSYSEYYDVMADYEEEAIVDDDEEEEDEEEYYDEDDVKYSDEDDEKYKYYDDDEDYAADDE